MTLQRNPGVLVGSNTDLDDAIKYRVAEAERALARGWALTPLRGKKPLLQGWTTLPPPTLEEVCRWARMGNLGLRTGHVSGVFVIDFDPSHGGDVVALELPPTPTVLTGGGGEHRYVAAPHGHLGNSASKLGPGIDTRGDGGQVVFPGSIHPVSGGVYRWAPEMSPDEIALATLPELVLARLRPPVTFHSIRFWKSVPVTETYGTAALRDERDRVRSSVIGTRNDTLNLAAFNLGQLVAAELLDEELVLHTLLHAALLVGLTQVEATSTIRSGIRAGRLHPRATTTEG